MKNEHFTYLGLDEVWKQWLLPLKLREISLVISYPGSDVRRRLLQLQSEENKAREYLGVSNKINWMVGDYYRDKWSSVADIRFWLGNKEDSKVVVIFGIEKMLRDDRADLIGTVSNRALFKQVF